MNNLGYDYLNEQDYDSAIKLFVMNTETYPKSHNVYDSLGEAYMKSGNKERAKECYTKALELNPNLASAQEALATLSKENS